VDLFRIIQSKVIKFILGFNWADIVRTEVGVASLARFTVPILVNPGMASWELPACIRAMKRWRATTIDRYVRLYFGLGTVVFVIYLCMS